MVHAFDCPFVDKILRLDHVTASPNQTRAERAGPRLRSPLDVPLNPTRIFHIDFRGCPGAVLLNETKWGLRLVFRSTHTISKVERLHVTRIRPQGKSTCRTQFDL